MHRTTAKGKLNEDQWWFKRHWRQIQTNLREIDMLDMDAERFVADLQSFKATNVLINTAGIIASYPTKHPYHFQSPFLKGDSLAQVIEACHKADITVMARTDFSKVRRPIYEQHPEWAYVSPKGEIVDYNGDVHVCFNSDYQQKHAFEIIEEALTTHDFDGLFFNMGGYQVKDYSNIYHGICQCSKCQERFDREYGLALPKAEDMNDPVFRKYLNFKRDTLQLHSRRVYEFVKSIRPNIVISNNKEQGGVMRYESYTEVHFPLPHWQYHASDNTKFVAGSYAPAIPMNGSTNFIGIQYRHVSVSPAQQELRMAQNLANAGAMDYYIIGRPDNHQDKTGFERIKKMFHFYADHEEEYASLASKAEIAVLHGGIANQNEFRGWFRFLTENHFLFDTVMMDAALSVPWDKYKAVIVPGFESISDEVCAKLDAFAAAGGTVISVGQAAFRSYDFELRDKPALQCLGVDSYELVRSDMLSAYFRLETDLPLPRMEQTSLTYLHGNYIYAKYNDNVRKHLKLIPPHNFGPPERTYYTIVTDNPGFTVHPYGKGQGIYIPWEPGTLFHRQGYTTTTDLIADVLEQAAGLQPVKSNVSPMVEVTLHEKKDEGSLLLQLVNTSGHFGVTFYDPVTMHGLEVTVACAKQPSEVRSLVSGQPVSFAWKDGELAMKLPPLELLEAVKISL